MFPLRIAHYDAYLTCWQYLAESREEGLPPESFLLQRCRDYFEEWAEEAFAEVGLNDIDLYLLTVYKKAKRIGK